MKTKTILVLVLCLFVVFSCKVSRYKQPKKPHNSFKPGKKNKWMEQKRENMRHF